MSIRFSCPSCGKQFSVSDDAAGKKGQCANCNAVMRVPVPKQNPPAYLLPEGGSTDFPHPAVKPVPLPPRPEPVADLPAILPHAVCEVDEEVPEVDEGIAQTWRLHLVIFALPCFFLMACLFAWAIVGTGLPAVGVLIALFWLFRTFLLWAATSVMLDDQLDYRRGFVLRRSLSYPMRQIETVGLSESLWGRIFGYAWVEISGAGGTRFWIGPLADGAGFREELQRRIDGKSRGR